MKFSLICLAVFAICGLQFTNAQNGKLPDIGASGNIPTSSIASYKDGVQFIQFFVPDFIYEYMNKLNGLGDLLKNDLEQTVADIGNARFDMAREIKMLRDNLKFALSRNPSMLAAFNELGDYASDQHTQAIIMLRKLLVVLVKATGPLLAASPNTPADEMFPTFAEILAEGTHCVNKVSIAISKAFNSVVRATDHYTEFDRMQPATSKLQNPLAIEGYYKAKGEMPAIKNFIEQEVNIAIANNPVCMYPALVNAFKEIGVTQPQDLSSLFPTATLPTPVEEPFPNAIFSKAPPPAAATNSAPMLNIPPPPMTMSPIAAPSVATPTMMNGTPVPVPVMSPVGAPAMIEPSMVPLPMSPISPMSPVLAPAPAMNAPLNAAPSMGAAPVAVPVPVTMSTPAVPSAPMAAQQAPVAGVV